MPTPEKIKAKAKVKACLFCPWAVLDDEAVLKNSISDFNTDHS